MGMSQSPKNSALTPQALLFSSCSNPTVAMNDVAPAMIPAALTRPNAAVAAPATGCTLRSGL